MKRKKNMLPGPGKLNLITDVSGLTVGHATDEAALTGVTVLRCEKPTTAAVELRGGAPGTRETDVLAPENLIDRVDALVLAGGSVFGLAAADGVTAELSNQGIGLRLTGTGPAIPIVPAAVLHDLGNEGAKDWGDKPPYRHLGREALRATSMDFDLGSVGAGRGANAGTVVGGIGSASIDMGGGIIVGAIVAVNSLGTVLLPDGKTFYAWQYEMDGEFGNRSPSGRFRLGDPFPEFSRLSADGKIKARANTTLAAVATTVDLTATELKRVAMMAHDGLARAIRPSHTPFDGDIVFALSTSAVNAPPCGDEMSRALVASQIGAASADCLARAVARGVFEAQPVAQDD